MPDYKAMYYHLAGQMSIAIEALEGLVAITERLKKAQQAAEGIFVNSTDDERSDDNSGEAE
jgi:hypothetical protein